MHISSISRSTFREGNFSFDGSGFVDGVVLASGIGAGVREGSGVVICIEEDVVDVIACDG